MSNIHIKEIISILTHEGFKYDITKNNWNCQPNAKTLYLSIDKPITIKWIINLFNFLDIKITPNDIYIIYIDISFQWEINLSHHIKNIVGTQPIFNTFINNISSLHSKDLDDLFEIITNDDSTELLQRIHLKNQIENIL